MRSSSFTKYVFFTATAMVSFLFFQCSNSANEDKLITSDQEVKPSRREKPTLVYDDKGNIIERHSYSYRSDNSIRAKEHFYYTYDDRNNLIEETKESESPQGELVYKNVNHYTYNSLNQKVEQKFFSYNKENQVRQQSRSTFRYNAKGEVIEEKSYFEDGSVKSIVNTERNDRGELQSEEYIYFDKEGKKTGHKKYHYSKYGLERTEDLMK